MTVDYSFLIAKDIITKEIQKYYPHKHLEWKKIAGLSLEIENMISITYKHITDGLYLPGANNYYCVVMDMYDTKIPDLFYRAHVRVDSDDFEERIKKQWEWYLTMKASFLVEARYKRESQLFQNYTQKLRLPQEIKDMIFRYYASESILLMERANQISIYL